MIDLQLRGQLTNRGKPAVLEYLESEDAAAGQLFPTAAGAGPDGGSSNVSSWPNWTRRLTAENWAGGVRCRDVMYGYK